MGDHEGTLQIVYDDISRKKLILTRFGGSFGALRVDEKFFPNNLLGFTPYWEYMVPILTNAIHAVGPGVHTREKGLNLSKIYEILSKSNIFDGSILDSLRHPRIYVSI